MTVRVPDILGDVLRLNPDYALDIRRSIEALSNDIRANAAVPRVTLPAPDMTTWGPEIEARPGATWLGTEWFFAECYVYRCLMTAVRYWETGRDPFAPAKSAELASDELWERVSVAHDASQGAPAEQRLVAAAWGQRVGQPGRSQLRGRRRVRSRRGGWRSLVR